MARWDWFLVVLEGRESVGSVLSLVSFSSANEIGDCASVEAVELSSAILTDCLSNEKDLTISVTDEQTVLVSFERTLQLLHNTADTEQIGIGIGDAEAVSG